MANHTRVTAVELYREGTFQVRAIRQDANRCGLALGDTFRYEVRLFAPLTTLDGQGFLMDARAIEAYWQEKYSSTRPKLLPSCEQIAASAVTDFRTLCRSLGVKLSGAEVRVWGGTHSAMTARWGKVPLSAAHPQHTSALPPPRSENIPATLRRHIERIVTHGQN